MQKCIRNSRNTISSRRSKEFQYLCYFSQGQSFDKTFFPPDKKSFCMPRSRAVGVRVWGAPSPLTPDFVKSVHPISTGGAQCFHTEVKVAVLNAISQSCNWKSDFFEVKLVPYASLCLENYANQFFMKFWVDWWPF